MLLYAVFPSTDGAFYSRIRDEYYDQLNKHFVTKARSKIENLLTSATFKSTRENKIILMKNKKETPLKNSISGYLKSLLI